MSSLHHLWGRRRSRSCQGRLGGVPQSASEGWWTRDNLMMGKTFSNKVTCEYWLRLLSCWMTLTAEVQAKHRAKLTNTIRNMMATTSSCHQGSRIQLVLLDDSSWCWWLADHKILCEGLGLSLLSRGCDDRDVVLVLFVFLLLLLLLWWDQTWPQCWLHTDWGTAGSPTAFLLSTSDQPPPNTGKYLLLLLTSIKLNWRSIRTTCINCTSPQLIE